LAQILNSGNSLELPQSASLQHFDFAMHFLPHCFWLRLQHSLFFGMQRLPHVFLPRGQRFGSAPASSTLGKPSSVARPPPTKLVSAVRRELRVRAQASK